MSAADHAVFHCLSVEMRVMYGQRRYAIVVGHLLAVDGGWAVS